MSSAGGSGGGGVRRRGRGRGSRASDDRGADRALRQKSDRQTYHDGMESDSDEEGHKQTFSVAEKLASPKFPKYFVKELKGEEVSLEYFQR